MSCPLCKSIKIDSLETISTKDITREYLSKFNIDVSSNFAHIPSISYKHCTNCDLYFFDPACPGDQVFYEKFQNFPWYYPTNKNEFEFAASQIPSGSRVLEIGSGKGAFAQFVNPKFYTGLEFSENAIKIAKSNGISVLNESIEAHSERFSKYYDVVCTFQVLEHVKNIHEFIASSTNALKIGGKFIVSVPSYDSFSRLVSNFELDMPPHHVSRWTDQTLKSICNSFQLKLDEIWHESLQTTHHHFFAYATTYNVLSKLFHLKPRIVHQSMGTKLLHKISWKMSKLFAHAVPHEALHSRGISVTAVYTKL